MISVLISTLGVWLIGLALLSIAGYGIGRWLTPSALKPYELLLTPLWGYGLLVFIAYYGLNSVLALPGALVLTLLVAIALGLMRWLRPGTDGRFPRVPLGELLLVAALSLIGAALGVVPLLRAGYLLPIGHGWDIEFYLPLAAYLQDYTYSTLNQAPSAPLLNVILAAPTSVRAIGFSYLHGMIDLIGRWSPVGTFPLLLALLRGLAVVPVYLLLRVGLRAGVIGAGLGALLVAGNELLLWISFNNFAMHVSSMPLVPLATLLTLLALAPNQSAQPSDDQSFWRGYAHALAGAIAATTMLTLSYHPGLLAYGALAGGLGVWALITQRRKLAVVQRGLLIIAGCLVLGWLAHWRAPAAFFDVYSVQTPSIGGERFARLTELLGVKTFHHLSIAVDGPAWTTAASWIALAALLLGLGMALWRGSVWRGPALAMLIFALLYALGLRFVIAFPYGFYKGVSYLNFLPLGVAGVGLGSFFASRPTRAPSIRWLRLAAGSGLTILALGMTGWSAYRLLETYRVPVLASGDLAAFTAELRTLSPGGTVLLVDHPELRGPGLGLASLGLYNHRWIGRGQTGFAVFNQSEPGRAAQLALMHPSEDPRAWGFEPADEILRSPGMVLYGLPANKLSFLSGNAAAYTPASGSLRQRLNSLEVQDLTHGDFQIATQDQPLLLYAALEADNSNRLSWQPLPGLGGLGHRRLVLDVSTEVAQPLTITIDGEPQRFDLTPGVSRVIAEPRPIAQPIEIRAGSEPIVVRSAQLWLADEQPAGATPLWDTLAVRTQTEVSAPAVTTTIDVTGAGRDAIHLGLELYEISERTPRRYASATLAVRSNEPATLQLDLQQLTATLNGGAVNLQPGSIEDGEYFGALWVYYGNTLVRRVPFVRFERRDGQITAIQPLDANATFARVSPPDQPIEATIGPAQLTGYTLSPQPARPGAELKLGLQWQVAESSAEPLLVFAQILGPNDHKWAAWDGAAGGDWWPSPVWQPGDRVWQELPLTLDSTTPPGRYRLVAGLYKASTGEAMPVSGPHAQNGLIVLSEIEVQP